VSCEILVSHLSLIFCQNETGVYTSVGYDFTNGIPTVIKRVIDYQFRPVWLGGIARRFTRPGLFNTKANMSMLSSFVQEGKYTTCSWL
jgi:hypothetical protein